MSNRALTAAFQHSASKGSARLVLLAMADEANDQGLLTAYRRSHSWLARKANVDEGTVRRAIRALEEAGEVETLARGDGRASSDYRLLLPDLEPVEGRQLAPPAPAGRAPRARSSPPQGAQLAPPINPLLPDASPDDPDTARAAEPLRLVSEERTEEPASFAAFWNAYPRKVGKPEAEKAWRAKVPGLGIGQAVMAGLERWTAYWTSRGEAQFIPHPSTWLRREGWNDEPPPLQAKPSQGQRAPVLADRSRPSGVVEL